MKLLTPSLASPTTLGLSHAVTGHEPLGAQSASGDPASPALSALQVSVCYFGKPLDQVALGVLKALHRTDIGHVRLLTHAHELATLTRWRPGQCQQVVIFDGLHSPGCNVRTLMRELARQPDMALMVVVRSPEEALQATQAGADHALHWPIDLLLLRAVLWGLIADFRQSNAMGSGPMAVPWWGHALERSESNPR